MCRSMMGAPLYVLMSLGLVHDVLLAGQARTALARTGRGTWAAGAPPPPPATTTTTTMMAYELLSSQP